MNKKTEIHAPTEAQSKELLAEHDAHIVELANGRAIVAVAIALGGGIKFYQEGNRDCAAVYSSVGAYSPVGYPPEGVYYGFAASALMAASYEGSVQDECEIHYSGADVDEDNEMAFCVVSVGGGDLASRILTI